MLQQADFMISIKNNIFTSINMDSTNNKIIFKICQSTHKNIIHMSDKFRLRILKAHCIF